MPANNNMHGRLQAFFASISPMSQLGLAPFKR